MAQSTRDGFTSTFGVLVATLGSAVGLGNIWKFPSLTGTNGGLTLRYRSTETPEDFLGNSYEVVRERARGKQK